jgi:hypothetical protein
MKRFMVLGALAVSGASSGWAGSILITFDNPNQTGMPGDTLVFMGVISNGGSSTAFLNSDGLNLLGNSFAVNDLFFSNVPISLDPGQSSPDIELFDVTLNNPFTDLSGTYTGTYGLLGGVDGNAQDMLGSANFSVTETSSVPEPSSNVLLAAALGALVGVHRGRSRFAKDL